MGGADQDLETLETNMAYNNNNNNNQNAESHVSLTLTTPVWQLFICACLFLAFLPKARLLGDNGDSITV